MECGDCKGSGNYVGLHEKERCRECDGRGVVGQEVSSAVYLGQAVRDFGPAQIARREYPEYISIVFDACLGHYAVPSLCDIEFVYLRTRPDIGNSWIGYDPPGHQKNDCLRLFDVRDDLYAMYEQLKGTGVFQLLSFKVAK